MNVTVSMPTEGALIAIGGAEDKSSESEILRTVLANAPEGNKRISVITTASMIPDEVFQGYREVFMALGADAVEEIDVREREDADRADYVRMVRESGVIFISGGDQMRLTSILGASKVLEAVRERRREGAVVAGTSAGAACMSSTMIYGGSATDALRKGVVRMSAGLGFVNGVIVDSHFLERGRFSRLMEAGATNPEYIGIGLGEDAGVIFHRNQIIEVIGPGHVVVVDSSKVTGSNVWELSDGEAVSVENVIMHALTSGYGYDVKNRETLQPSEVDQIKMGQRVENTGAQGVTGT
jgi:cyanophycinase